MSEKERVCSNTHDCTCPWTDCPNHGHCCDCIANHRPGVPNCFPKPGEFKDEAK